MHHHTHDGTDHEHAPPRRLRLTHLRRRVLDIVAAAAHPVTAYEILDFLRPHDASATAAGVYRSLDFLTRNGFAHRLETTKAFIACSMPDRAHMSQFLVCRTCGLAIETENAALSAAILTLAADKGFDVSRGTVEISGQCSTCFNK